MSCAGRVAQWVLCVAEERPTNERKQTTRPNPRLPVAPNVLNQDFTAQRPDQKWVADFTYIATAQGWLYLATVMDVFSRQIVGWSMSERQQTALVEDALRMGLARRCPQAGLLHHSDRGSQYSSYDTRAACEGARPSQHEPKWNGTTMR